MGFRLSANPHKKNSEVTKTRENVDDSFVVVLDKVPEFMVFGGKEWCKPYLFARSMMRSKCIDNI